VRINRKDFFVAEYEYKPCMRAQIKVIDSQNVVKRKIALNNNDVCHGGLDIPQKREKPI